MKPGNSVEDKTLETGSRPQNVRTGAVRAWEVADGKRERQRRWVDVVGGEETSKPTGDGRIPRGADAETAEVTSPPVTEPSR